MSLTLLHDLLHGSTAQWKQLTKATPQWDAMLLHAFEQQKASPVYLFNNLFKIKEVCSNTTLKPHLIQWMAHKSLYASNKSKEDLALDFLSRSLRKIQLRAIEQQPENTPNVLMSLPSVWSLITKEPNTHILDVLQASMLHPTDMGQHLTKTGYVPEEFLVRYNHALGPMLHAYYIEHQCPATRLDHIWAESQNKMHTMGIICAYAGQSYLTPLEQMTTSYMWSIHTSPVYKEAMARAYPDSYEKITQQAQQIWALFQVYSVTPTTYDDVLAEVEKYWQAPDPSLHSNEAFEYTGDGISP